MIFRTFLFLSLITSSLIASETPKQSSAPATSSAAKTGKVSIRTVFKETLRKLGRETDPKINALVNRQITLDIAFYRKMKDKLDHEIATDPQNGQSIKQFMDFVNSQPISYPKLCSAQTVLRQNFATLDAMLEEQSCPSDLRKIACMVKSLEADANEVAENDDKLETVAPGFQKAFRERSEANNIRTIQQLIDVLNASEE